MTLRQRLAEKLRQERLNTKQSNMDYGRQLGRNEVRAEIGPLVRKLLKERR